MRKLPITLLAIFSLALFSNGAIAQNKPLACQVDKAAGLEWENGRWVTRTYNLNTNKFILVQTKDGLTTDSAAKALSNAFPEQVSCINGSRSTCFDASGGYLFFDQKTLKGATSQMIGSISNGTEKDSVTVGVFSCTPF